MTLHALITLLLKGSGDYDMAFCAKAIEIETQVGYYAQNWIVDTLNGQRMQ